MLLLKCQAFIAAILNSNLELSLSLLKEIEIIQSEQELTYGLNFRIKLTDTTPCRSISPLHAACLSRHAEELVSLFLSKGASPILVSDLKKKTPLHYAQDNNQLAAAEILISHYPELITIEDDNEKSPLHYAAESEDKFDFLNIYLRLETDHQGKPCPNIVNSVNAQDWTPLHYAALGNNKTGALLLLEQGANIHAMTKEGNKAVDCYIIKPELKHLLRDRMFPTLFSLAAKVIHAHPAEEQEICQFSIYPHFLSNIEQQKEIEACDQAITKLKNLNI